MQGYDVVIIGAGHNGLTCAAYLAMAGLRVKVVERRKVVGGAAVTEEFHPGFRNSVAAYTVSLLNPQIIAGSEARRSRPADRRTPRAEFPARARWPLSARPAKAAPNADREASASAMPQRFDAFNRDLEAIADVLRALRAAGAAESRRRGSASERHSRSIQRRAFGNRHPAQAVAGASAHLLDLFTRSAGEMLDERFESDLVKALFGFDAIVGNYASPYAAGLGLCAAAPRVRRGERQEGRLGPCHRRHGRDHAGHGAGGARHGVEIETDAGVREVIVEKRPRGRRRPRRTARSCVAQRSPPTSIRNCSTPLIPESALAGLSAPHARAGATAPAPSA